MSAVESVDQQFEFVRQLARDLNAGSINLPSFPAVIIKIRDMLEDEECDFARLGETVSADAALVSRLFIFANSTYHNRTGDKVTSLHDAISRLGLELVRNTALALAIKQLALSDKHRSIAPHLKRVWILSMRLSSLAHAVASYVPNVRDEDAFMCGLFHEIGKVYILTKARDFPGFLDDVNSLNSVLDEWHTQIGQCIVEAWGFPGEIVRSMAPGEHFNGRTHVEPELIDTVLGATLLHQTDEDNWPELMTEPVFRKLGISTDKLAELGDRNRLKLDSIQQSLS